MGKDFVSKVFQPSCFGDRAGHEVGVERHKMGVGHRKTLCGGVRSLQNAGLPRRSCIAMCFGVILTMNMAPIAWPAKQCRIRPLRFGRNIRGVLGIQRRQAGDARAARVCILGKFVNLASHVSRVDQRQRPPGGRNDLTLLGHQIRIGPVLLRHHRVNTAMRGVPSSIDEVRFMRGAGIVPRHFRVVGVLIGQVPKGQEVDRTRPGDQRCDDGQIRSRQPPVIVLPVIGDAMSLMTLSARSEAIHACTPLGIPSGCRGWPGCPWASMR